MTPRVLINSVEVVERSRDGKKRQKYLPRGSASGFGDEDVGLCSVPCAPTLHVVHLGVDCWTVSLLKAGAAHWSFLCLHIPLRYGLQHQRRRKSVVFYKSLKTSDWAMCSQEKDLSTEGWKHRGAKC